jgi:dihydrofolate synthase/folylpolyglutamate synthase
VALRDYHPPRPLHALVGIRNDKDWPAMLATLRPAVDRLLLTVAPSVPGPQRWAAADFAGGQSSEDAARFEPDFDRALAQIQDGARTVLVTGSFHTVGDAMARLPGLAPLG